MAQTSSTEKPREPRPRALRMTLVARRAEIKRESQDVIDMVAPPSDRVDEYENESGFWVELRDRENRVLYRRVLHDPLNLHIEAPSGDLERPFTNIENKKVDAIFSVMNFSRLAGLSSAFVSWNSSDLLGRGGLHLETVSRA